MEKIFTFPLLIKWSFTKDEVANLKQGEQIKSESMEIDGLPGVRYNVALGTFVQEEGVQKSITLQIICPNLLQIKHKCDIVFNDECIETSHHTVYWTKSSCNFRLASIWSFNHLLRISNDLVMEGTLMVLVRDPFPGKSIGHHLWERKDKDFVFVVENKEIEIHKCVMGACSPAFDSMFQLQMKEAIEGKATIQEFAYETVLAATKYCYDFKLDRNVSENELIELLKFSDMYQMDYLKDSIQCLLIDYFCNYKFVERCNYAALYNAAKLKDFYYCMLLKAIYPEDHEYDNGWEKPKEEETDEERSFKWDNKAILSQLDSYYVTKFNNYVLITGKNF